LEVQILRLIPLVILFLGIGLISLHELLLLKRVLHPHHHHHLVRLLQLLAILINPAGGSLIEIEGRMKFTLD